ncbi:MAG: ABC transporter permease subunit [Ectothiorhodospiraceae bacterium AqS1]|nr:ABC transporter permease subunit [Ectothiorhodospiraceae bacterium AqS1]MBF2761247.1 ABC transporter permease subunit [Ectothiorhodospiraceae bacterium AqS1]MBF2761501.1 ABC transporter permease subunit [Ectothiorhodospiraceae bacterium AqS1]
MLDIVHETLKSITGGILHGYLYPYILEGMLLTLVLAALSLLLAVALGLVAAGARLSSLAPARTAAWLYTTIIRGIPDIVLMFIFFFGGQLLLNEIGYRLSELESAWRLPFNPGWDYIEISEFTAGVLTIGIIFGAYMAETFRGAILSVSIGEIEAGHAFGMSKGQVFRRITLPASVRHALPGFGNNWMVLVKTTALVSVIGLEDMVFRATQAGGTTREPFLFYLAVALLYLMITLLSESGLRRIESRFSLGVRSAQESV